MVFEVPCLPRGRFAAFFCAFLVVAGQNGQDAMYVVWHHDEYGGINPTEMIGNASPALFYRLTAPVQDHRAVNDVAKKVTTITCADGYKI
jgi:hypothetical protein